MDVLAGCLLNAQPAHCCSVSGNDDYFYVFYKRLNSQVMERERYLSVRMLVVVRMMRWCYQYMLDSHQPGACPLLTIPTAVWLHLHKLTPMQPPSQTTLGNTLKHKHNVCQIDLGTFICLLGDPAEFIFDHSLYIQHSMQIVKVPASIRLKFFDPLSLGLVFGLRFYAPVHPRLDNMQLCANLACITIMMKNMLWICEVWYILHHSKHATMRKFCFHYNHDHGWQNQLLI